MSNSRFVPPEATVFPLPSEHLTERIDAAIHAAESLTMEAITNAEQLEVRLASLRRGHCNELLLCALNGGLLSFVAAAFPGLAVSAVHARHCFREPQGQGPHFDVYGPILDKAFPWVAVFNIVGDASVRALRLHDALAIEYFHEHPEASVAASQARRHTSAEAFAIPGAQLSQGVLWRHSGLIIPQLPAGPHWVHDIAPLHPDKPGQFLKLLVPPRSLGAERELSMQGYKPLDDVVSSSFEKNTAPPSDADSASLLVDRLLD